MHSLQTLGTQTQMRPHSQARSEVVPSHEEEGTAETETKGKEGRPHEEAGSRGMAVAAPAWEDVHPGCLRADEVCNEAAVAGTNMDMDDLRAVVGNNAGEAGRPARMLVEASTWAGCAPRCL